LPQRRSFGPVSGWNAPSYGERLGGIFNKEEEEEEEEEILEQRVSRGLFMTTIRVPHINISQQIFEEEKES